MSSHLAEALSKFEQASRGNEMALKALVEFQSLVAFDPGNMVYLRNLGLCYSVVALARSTLGANVKASGRLRLQPWGEARDLYQKTFAIFSDLQRRGARRPTDSNTPLELAGKINLCDEAIRHLQAQRR